jgi:hypothetical protein
MALIFPVYPGGNTKSAGLFVAPWSLVTWFFSDPVLVMGDIMLAFLPAGIHLSMRLRPEAA